MSGLKSANASWTIAGGPLVNRYPRVIQQRDVEDETYEQLEKALPQLQSRRAEAVVLHFYEGLDYGQIGSRMGVTREAARKSGERGIMDLRTCMKTVHLADRDAYGRNCIRNGSHGWTMEADQTTPPAEPIRHAREVGPDRCAPRRQRVAVFEPDGLPVADAAPGVRSLAPRFHHYYRTWRRDGTLQKIHDALRQKVRVQADRKPSPSAAIIDSQSVKTVEKGGG